MIRPNLILDLNAELFVDNFAGGGGASTGIERALGRHVDHAVNHDKCALGMHRINHPQTIHHCEDVFDVHPATLTEGRPVAGGWFSPDCKHFSKAKGGKPLSKKIRGLAFVILRWAKIRTRVIYMENVEEIQTWGPLLENGKPDPAHKGRTWKSFLAALGNGVESNNPDLDEMLEVLGNSITRAELIGGFGYEIETRELRACDYGAPTIRKRLFLIARCDGMPIVWPEPTHEDYSKWKAESGKRKLKPWVPVSTCIDWDIPCNSIFLNKAQAKAARCRRPLADSTLRRIATGIDRYVLKAKKPFLVSLTHQGGERIEPIDEPIDTITAAHRGEKALVEASFISEHANASNQRNMPIDEPCRTQCAEVKGGHFSLVGAHMIQKGHLKSNSKMIKGANEPMRCQTTRGEHGIVATNLVKMRSKNIGDAADKPLHTVSAAGQHHALSKAFLAQHNGGFNETPGHPATEPISTVSAKGSQQQIVAANLVRASGFDHDIGQKMDEPGRTLTCKEQFEVIESKLAAGTLAAYYGNDEDGQATDTPVRTVTTRERFGFVKSDLQRIPPMTPEQIVGARRVAAFLRQYGVQFEGEFATITVDGMHLVIVDIGMRMLTARELFRAQGFGDDYIIDRAWVIDPQTGATEEIELTKEQQIRMCGNSVCPDVAEALVRANSFDLSVWRLSEAGRLKNKERVYA